MNHFIYIKQHISDKLLGAELRYITRPLFIQKWPVFYLKAIGLFYKKLSFTEIT